MTNGRRGPKPKLSDSQSLNLSIPQETYEFLHRLGELGKLGNTVPMVAEHILINETNRLQSAGFHKRTLDD